MDSVRQQSVYRYFDLADSFVEIRITDPHCLNLSSSGLDKAGYRRLVISTCMPEFSSDVAGAIETLFPDDPLMVEDILYQLCIEVNPGLSIHEVRLQIADPALEVAPEGSPALALDLMPRIAGLENRLAGSVLGQEEAIRQAARAVGRAAVGLGPGDRPLASMLFAGRTGTGKTELARVLSTELMGTGSLVRIDCSEFALAHEYSKLIGAPPGFVGHDDGGQLTDRLRKSPSSVVVFDEVEKAHPKLHNLMLQVLEEGALTDGKGRRVSFQNAVVVLTSNVGADEVQRKSHSVGFERDQNLEHGAQVEVTEQALESTFSPEFLGRLDEIVLFKNLSPETLQRIAAQKLEELRVRAESRGIVVSFTPAVARWAASQSKHIRFGAREIRHVIQRQVEPFLVDELTQSEPSETIRLGIRKGQLYRIL